MTFSIVISYISALFLSELLHTLPWHGENILFLIRFHSSEMCCSVTACSHWPFVQHQRQTSSHRRDLHFATWGSAVATRSPPLHNLQSDATQSKLPLLHTSFSQYTEVGQQFSVSNCFACSWSYSQHRRKKARCYNPPYCVQHHLLYVVIYADVFKKKQFR